MQPPSLTLDNDSADGTSCDILANAQESVLIQGGGDIVALCRQDVLQLIGIQ